MAAYKLSRGQKTVWRSVNMWPETMLSKSVESLVQFPWKSSLQVLYLVLSVSHALFLCMVLLFLQKKSS